MILFAHLTSINKNKLDKINFFINELRKNCEIDIYSYVKIDNIETHKISHDNSLLDFSTYLEGINICFNKNESCIFVNDTFFEYKFFFKLRAKNFCKKILINTKGPMMVGHVMKYQKRVYVPTYLFYLNNDSINYLYNNAVFKVLLEEGISSIKSLLSSDIHFSKIYYNHENVYKLYPLGGVKWHNNMLVNASVRRAKLICSVCEQYLYDVLSEKNAIFFNVLDINILSKVIFKIENKFTLLKAKIKFLLKNKNKL